MRVLGLVAAGFLAACASAAALSEKERERPRHRVQAALLRRLWDVPEIRSSSRFVERMTRSTSTTGPGWARPSRR